MKKGSVSNIESRININKKIIAPIKKGDILGKVEFYLDGGKLGNSNLVANSSVDKIGIFNNFKFIIHNWFCLFR